MCHWRGQVQTLSILLEDNGFPIFKPGNFGLFPQGVKAIGPTEQDGGGAFWDTGVSGGRHEPGRRTVMKGIYDTQETKSTTRYLWIMYELCVFIWLMIKFPVFHNICTTDVR